MKSRKTASSGKRGKKSPEKKAKPANLRIIGGDMRGRNVRYHGADFTRPMKDNIRENLFNILGKAPKGTVSYDLFAGTAALAFESLSRGSNRAVIIEQSKRAVDFIRRTAEELQIESRVEILTGDTFKLVSHVLGPPEDDTPWIVFLCPPYILWHEALSQMNEIVSRVLQHAPPGSVLVCETDKAFDVANLPATEWDHRQYGNVRLSFAEPAMVCGLRM